MSQRCARDAANGIGRSRDKGKSMFTLGIILARAGSKGLPQKNALTVAGRPMLAWTIDHARSSRLLDRVMLSTDGEALAAIGREQGIEVVLRPEELASDTATVDSAARHAVLSFERRRGEQVDAAVILYGNVPVRPRDLTDRAVSKLIQTSCDSVQSVYPVGKNHPYWMKVLRGADGDSLGMYQDNAVYRRQDLPAVYMLDGGVIAVTRRNLFTVRDDEPHAFLGSDRRAIITGEGDVIDIDSELDCRVAEAVLLRHEQAGKQP